MTYDQGHAVDIDQIRHDLENIRVNSKAALELLTERQPPNVSLAIQILGENEARFEKLIQNLDRIASANDDLERKE